MNTDFKMKKLTDNLIRLNSTDSTNEEAFRLSSDADMMSTGRFAVVSDYQTAGKGRLGRSFESPKSMGLYLSVLETDVISLDLTAFSAVAVCKCLCKLTSLDCKIKWPNDIQINGKKLCGILTEMRCGKIVIGIGINLYQDDFGNLNDIACSLSQSGIKLDREVLLMELLTEIDYMLDNYHTVRNDYLEFYKDHCCSLNQDIWLIQGDNKIPACSIDIDEDFSLIVKLSDDSIARINSGEISLRIRTQQP